VDDINWKFRQHLSSSYINSLSESRCDSSSVYICVEIGPNGSFVFLNLSFDASLRSKSIEKVINLRTINDVY
jgi:hypothetical protein